MKKFLFLLVFVFASMGGLQAETIDAVYFNPSRLGYYNTLKVVDALNVTGNATVQNNMAIRGGSGTSSLVTINNAGNVNVSEKLTVSGTGGVNMPNAAVSVKTLSLNSGQAIFNQNALSNIREIKLGSHALTIYADQANIDGLTVDTHSTSNRSIYNGTSTENLPTDIRLGGVPIADMTSLCKDDGHGTMTLDWVTRIASDKKKYQVLGCEAAAAPTSCTYQWVATSIMDGGGYQQGGDYCGHIQVENTCGGTCNADTYGQTCYRSTAEAAQDGSCQLSIENFQCDCVRTKADLCPSAPKTNTDCWTPNGYTWETSYTDRGQCGTTTNYTYTCSNGRYGYGVDNFNETCNAANEGVTCSGEYCNGPLEDFYAECVKAYKRNGW